MAYQPPTAPSLARYLDLAYPPPTLPTAALTISPFEVPRHCWGWRKAYISRPLVRALSRLLQSIGTPAWLPPPPMPPASIPQASTLPASPQLALLPSAKDPLQHCHLCCPSGVLWRGAQSALQRAPGGNWKAEASNDPRHARASCGQRSARCSACGQGPPPPPRAALADLKGEGAATGAAQRRGQAPRGR